MDYDYDDLMRSLEVLYICARMIEEGHWTNENVEFTMHCDYFYEVVLDALYVCCENVFVSEKEDTYITSYYFSDPCMMEYYRLCREYSRRRGIRLKDNPYMKKAYHYVYEQLRGDYNSDFVLHTKTNHKCASGIHFLHDENFCGEMGLLDRLLNIFSFYREEAKKLKTELAKPTALAVIYTWPIRKAVAA